MYLTEHKQSLCGCFERNGVAINKESKLKQTNEEKSVSYQVCLRQTDTKILNS